MSKTATELQAERNAEGRGLAREHAAQLEKDLAPLNKQNEKWMATESNVIGSGPDGKGTAGLAAQRHAEAKKMGAK